MIKRKLDRMMDKDQDNREFIAVNFGGLISAPLIPAGIQSFQQNLVE